MIKISKENKKVSKLDAVSFGIQAFAIPLNILLDNIRSLPATHQAKHDARENLELEESIKTIDGKKYCLTCPSAGTCGGICYALQGSYRWNTVKAARAWNTACTFLDNFASHVIKSLEKIKRPIVRIHDSGDFYSLRYFQQWVQVAKALPNKIFYGYTKALTIVDFNALPSNFHLVQSMGGKHDDIINPMLPIARIFASHAAREKAGYINGNLDDMPAITGEKRIGLVYHGVKKLTEQQKQFFK